MKKQRWIPAAAIPALPTLAALLTLTPFPGAAQNFGSVDFPTSGAAEAQPHFEAGLLLLHNFEYEDAAIRFRRAREIDPGFAMAYWGEAQTHNHPIWMQQDRDAALAILQQYAHTPAERLARVPTERERDWFETVEVLYGDGSKQARDFRYRDAMRRLSEKYPDDHDAAALYALSLLGTAHDGRDFAIYMKAAAVAQSVFEANPLHPGAAHYIIHAFDDPVHAPLGLPAARAYSEIAPDASHAQHMTSHIFVAMGLWDDVVTANVRARDVAERGAGAEGAAGQRVRALHVVAPLRSSATGAAEGRGRGDGGVPGTHGRRADARRGRVLREHAGPRGDRRGGLGGGGGSDRGRSGRVCGPGVAVRLRGRAGRAQDG